jgi:hypothetical protein
MAGQHDTIEFTADGQVITALTAGPATDAADDGTGNRIGAAYTGEAALRPNFGLVFTAPGLWQHVRHGPAVHYWIINPAAPALMGPIDRDDTWWLIAFGVHAETGEREAVRLIDAAERIQRAKQPEFHSLDLVLGVRLEDSPVIALGPDVGAQAGALLPHAWLGSGRSLYDELGAGFTLLVRRPDAGRDQIRGAG